MKLIKFLVKEVQEEANEITPYSFSGRKVHKIKRWDYIIKDENGNEYYLYSHKPERICRNMELRCFVQEREDKRFNIEYHSLYKTKLLSPLLFREAKENYIQRAKHEIEFWQKELQRLEQL